MSPLESVRALRLEDARQMLASSERPIEAIANAVGYEDAGFDNRLLRRKVNMTPARCRNRVGALRRSLAPA